jgi:nucleotide-binding universal stress UspA family protein
MNTAISRPRRIVGVDGTATAEAAVRWAARRSAADGAPLVLAHVTPSAAQPGVAILEEAQRIIDAQQADVTVRQLHLRGPVWKALDDVAERDDVIVVGTDGWSPGRSRMSGASSVQLAITTRCAVTVIPDVDLRYRRGITAGIGAASTAPRVAQAAHVEARGYDAPLTLVHGGCSDRCAGGLDAAERSLRAIDPAISVRRRVLSTPTADALLDATLDKELLVLGRGSRTASGSPIGAVTLTVLMNATVPVLLLPPG